MIALVYGALWGLGEATLGHLLHLLHIPGLPGLVMAPFAVAVMARAARAARSNAGGTVFLAGAVAASLKLLDLLVPGTDIPALINPIQAILLEALAGGILAKTMEMGAGSPVPWISTGLQPSDRIRALPSDGRP